jgi:hypothetical protein
VWCSHESEEGGNESAGVLSVKLICVEMVVSRVATQISASNWLPRAPYVYILLQIR